MAGRIVLFGATGYTGELTARELVSRGAKPILAARSQARASALAEELGGLEWEVADVDSPTAISSLLGEGDVLITTVGPFAKLGDAALRAAVESGAHYVDSTGEPAWIRKVFDSDRKLSSAGIAAIPAFGYDYVPGNLAAGLALDEAGGEATSVHVGYFARGPVAASGGTLASLTGALLERGHEYRHGELRPVRPAASERTFDTSAGLRSGVSIGGSEHFAIPQIAPSVDEVGVFLGMFGGSTAPVRYGSAAISAVTRVPGVRKALGWGAGKALPGSTGGPTAAERSRTTSLAVAEALDADGRRLSQVEVTGPNPYDITAGFLAWAGITLATEGPLMTGALGPVAAFGLDALAVGCSTAGLVRNPAAS